MKTKQSKTKNKPKQTNEQQKQSKTGKEKITTKTNKQTTCFPFRLPSFSRNNCSKAFPRCLLYFHIYVLQ